MELTELLEGDAHNPTELSEQYSKAYDRFCEVSGINGLYTLAFFMALLPAEQKVLKLWIETAFSKGFDNGVDATLKRWEQLNE